MGTRRGDFAAETRAEQTVRAEHAQKKSSRSTNKVELDLSGTSLIRIPAAAARASVPSETRKIQNRKRKENWILKHLENLARGTLAPGAGSRLHECRDPLRRPSHRVERPPPSRLSVSHLTSRHSTTRHSPDSTGAHATRPIRTHDTNTHKTAHMTQTRTGCPRRFLQTPLLCTPQFRNSLRSSLLLT